MKCISILADEGKAHLYTHKALNPLIDDILGEIGFVFDDKTTWWEVTDALFLAGFSSSGAYLHSVMRCLYWQMLRRFVELQVIEDLYGQVRAPTGEPLIQAFGRMISSSSA